MAKKTKPKPKPKRANPIEDEDLLGGFGSLFDGANIDENVAGAVKQIFTRKNLGDLLIAAGEMVKSLTPKRATDGIDQRGKPIQIVDVETLLDGGTQTWTLSIKGKPLIFKVDRALDSKTPGHIFIYNRLGFGQSKIVYGGKTEKEISRILQLWLDQFWTSVEQIELRQRAPAKLDEDPYPSSARAAAQLIQELDSRQKEE